MGSLWQDDGLVFLTITGTTMSGTNLSPATSSLF